VRAPGLNIAGVVADARKITDYLLNEDHADGRPKARFFKGFGFTLEDWRTLQSALEAHPSLNPVKESRSTRWGTKYIVECNFPTPDGRDPCILTVWLQAEPGAPAVLVTAYPVGG
jgi:filamentous hemagglutinin